MTLTSIEVPESMATAFSGPLLRPGDDGYDDARAIHNGMIDKHPGLIARCANTADVVDAVTLARETGAELSVRGGGHNVAGRAVTDGGVMIDLAPMGGIHVDPAARTVRAQPGLTWRQFDRATALFGLATTGGQVSSTGIAGLTLGGGLGWLMGRYGLTVDNLLGTEVVLASGEVVGASADHHADLFWALRGGGGNFGVVTSFLYQVHPLSDVLGGILAYPLDAAADVVDLYRTFTSSAPDELGVGCGFVHAPDGSGNKIVALPLCHCGDDLAAAEADIKPLRQFGPPILDAVGTIPYPAVNTLLDGAFPKGKHNYWKSAFLTELNADVIATLADAYEQVPSPMSAIVIEHIHGAATRVAPDATAFPHRQAGYNILVIGQWADPADTQPNVAWARQTFEALRPHLAAGRYVNYMSADDTSYIHEAYGANWDRLVASKRRYDPTNLFKLNQNIDPDLPQR